MKDQVSLASKIVPSIVGSLQLVPDQKEENTKLIYRANAAALRMAKRILNRIDSDNMKPNEARMFQETAIIRASKLPINNLNDEAVKKMIDNEITLAAKNVGMFKESVASYKKDLEKAATTTKRSREPISEEELT